MTIVSRHLHEEVISDAAWLFDSAEKDIQEIEGKARKKVETDIFKAALLTPQRIMELFCGSLKGYISGLDRFLKM